MVSAAAILFAVNGTVSKVILASGVSSTRLAQVRSTGAFAVLLVAIAFAMYVLLAGRAVSRRDAFSVSFYGFFFATLFWAIVQPWWSFPRAVPGRDVSLLGNLADLHLPVWVLLTWMVFFGTIVPF